MALNHLASLWKRGRGLASSETCTWEVARSLFQSRAVCEPGLSVCVPREGLLPAGTPRWAGGPHAGVQARSAGVADRPRCSDASFGRQGSAAAAVGSSVAAEKR